MTLFAAIMQSDTLMWLAILGGMVAIVFFTMVILLKANYKRCSSNQVLVIFGKTSKGQAAKTVHGGAAFVWPLIQDYSYLSLEPIQIEIPLRRRFRWRTSASTCRACSPWPSAPSPM